MSSDPQSTAHAILADLNADRAKPAYLAAKKAMSRFPKEVGFVNLAAMALARQGRLRDALALFQKAVKLAPGNLGYHINMIQALISLGQHPRAGQLIERLLAKRPDHAELLYLLAVTRMNDDTPDAAIDAASRAIAADPALARAHNLRGALWIEQGDETAALADYQAALAIDPTSPDTLTNIALPLVRLHRGDEALAALEQALTLAPGHVNALHRYALQLAEAGRLDDARAAYHRLLALTPHHAEALSELVALDPPAALAALRAPIRAALDHAPRASADHGYLAFALARLEQRSGNPDEARRWFAAANATVARQRPHDAAHAHAEFDRVMRDFPTPAPLPAGPADADDPDPVPIFVIGQPRSGTTLTEQVLGAHPAVLGLGENAAAGRLVRALHVGDDTPFDPADFAARYRASLPPAAATAVAVVDKMPANYRYLGYLAAAFPRASFVHVARDPRDVALSMWHSFFPARAMNYTFDLAAMADQANLYRRYMTHWQALLGDRLLTLPYEDVVVDITAASRRLAAHCGLDWDPAMASPERNTAPVRTASLAQVRAPVHRRSVGGWRDQAAFLLPFLSGLDPALWPDLKP